MYLNTVFKYNVFKYCPALGTLYVKSKIITFCSCGCFSLGPSFSEN